MSRFENQVVLITGGSSGIGLCAARSGLCLASADAAYITGAELPVDGGLSQI